jgi:UDP-N-acetylglucosamine--N-acetylmuramyl-(pentapeptide) pyrophosphoryl-undecaprenol N-acetylglucosamine transferase
MSKKIIIAGGGTGGHIFPAIAIANALKEKDNSITILFVGARNKMEMEKIPQAGYEIKGLDIAGLNRSSLIKNMALPFKIIKSFWQVRNIFKTFKPDAVIGVGGYSTFPVLKYAQLRNIPTFIHESNSFAGKTNILLGKNAAKIFVASDGMEKFFSKEKIIVTGNPVRKTIANAAINRSEAIKYFSLEEEKITLLVVGGSLGARSINEAVFENINLLLKAGLQIIWQTGKSFSKEAAHEAAEHKEIYVNEFIANMEYAYAAADIIMARAGAMTIAEISVAKKPTVFIPFPNAAEDHQTMNAQLLVNKGAALMVKDSEAKEKAIPTIIELAKNNALRNEMSEKLVALAIKNADEIIANEIIKRM